MPSGMYYRTYTNDGSGPTGEADPATVSAVRLDKYLVTVGRYRQFAAAVSGGWTPPQASGKHVHLASGQGLANIASPGTYEPGWQTADNANVAPTTANLFSCGVYSTWTSAPDKKESLPIDCVNWYEAYAFCIWDDAFLPSEAEQGYAEAGGSLQRQYPWGSAAPGTSSQYAIYGCYFPLSAGTCTDTDTSNIAPVGTAALGAGLWGQLDLVGSFYEWGLDSYGSYVTPCIDCANVASTSEREVRGAYFANTADYLSSAHRNYAVPTTRYSIAGFRCARTP
jgi:formylglycine-generating enzyme required for sulfatase activity